MNIRIPVIILAAIIGMTGCGQPSDASSPACKYIGVIGSDVKHGYAALYLVPVALAKAQAGTRIAAAGGNAANINGTTISDAESVAFFIELDSALTDCELSPATH
jgi:hypothetical protein